jgi:hypothetical protein
VVPKKIITKSVLFAAILAVAVLVIMWVSTNARATRAAGTVLLSNGKSVYIGQSKAALEDKLKDSVRILDDSYSYIGSNGVVEGVFFMSDNKVSAVRITSNSSNRHQATNIGISAGRSSIGKIKDKGLTQLDATEKLTGYKYKSSSAVGYFLTSPCAINPRINTMVISAPGKEASILPETTRISPCEGDI